MAWFEVGHRLFDLFGTEAVVCIRFCLMLAGALGLLSRTLPGGRDPIRSTVDC